MVTLLGVDGSQHPLMAKGALGNIWLRKGAKGLDMPPFDVQVDEYPARDGEYPRAARGLAREIFLPLTIYGKTRPELVAAKRRLLRALPPTQMFGRMARLVVAEVKEDGEYEPQREIEVYYSGGLEGDEGSENGLMWAKFGLVLRSTDPFFRSLQDTVVDFLTVEDQVPFYPPEGEPFVSPDGESGGFKVSPPPRFTNEVTVINEGDVAVKPTWHLVGPISEPFSLVRAATVFSPEQVLSINGLALDVGETATLVTTPGKVRLTTSAGSNVTWSALAPNPDFWYLDPGENQITVVGLSEDPGAISLSYRTKYLGM